ncbi:MAG: glycine betaine ABC transporter substrate-binding protein [Epsilonproteobacteria bacterium]|nr:glycine betaine ABC transporter substrate-binding protein [Campylobacterota bacterium]
MKKLTVILLVLFSFATASTIVVGGKNFTEQQFLAEATTQLLEAHGFNVDKKSGMGSTILRKAQINGQVDIYWEYTGTSLVVYNKVNEKLNAAETYKRVKKLDKKVGLVWLNPSKANDTYAFAMRLSDKNKYSINTISDLAKAIKDKKELKIGLNAEFSVRSDGMPGIEKAYNFQLPRDLVVKMDSGLIYTALKNKNIAVGLVFATDGRISAFDLYTLKDDKGFFPNYAIVPVIREKTLKKYPKLGKLLNKMSAVLTDKVMINVNKSIDVDKKSTREVAKNFLKQFKLI